VFVVFAFAFFARRTVNGGFGVDMDEDVEGFRVGKDE